MRTLFCFIFTVICLSAKAGMIMPLPNGTVLWQPTMLSDGSFVALVRDNSWTSNYDGFLVMKYLSNGTLDPSFGNNGVLDLKGDGSGQYYEPVQMLTDHKDRIILSGRKTVTRILPNGTIDNSFGTGGQLTRPLGPLDAELNSLLFIDQQNRIMVTSGVRFVDLRGYKKYVTSMPKDFERNKDVDSYLLAFARLSENGKLDTSFGFNGGIIPVFGELQQPGSNKVKMAVQTATASGSFTSLKSVTFEPVSNNIVAITQGQCPGTDYFDRCRTTYAIRLQPNGRPDPTVGYKNKNRTPGYNIVLPAVKDQEDRMNVIPTRNGGYAFTWLAHYPQQERCATLMRVLRDLTPDTFFNHTGQKEFCGLPGFPLARMKAYNTHLMLAEDQEERLLLFGSTSQGPETLQDHIYGFAITRTGDLDVSLSGEWKQGVYVKTISGQRVAYQATVDSDSKSVSILGFENEEGVRASPGLFKTKMFFENLLLN